jgi:hypothetical protein
MINMEYINNINNKINPDLDIKEGELRNTSDQIKNNLFNNLNKNKLHKLRDRDRHWDWHWHSQYFR